MSENAAGALKPGSAGEAGGGVTFQVKSDGFGGTRGMGSIAAAGEAAAAGF
jgi:hypothetical protein